ncbi:hypothetical protein SCHPADRAFT_515611 [Schizopora paradoxa]|uniref:Uncharacterized protein n=1 Tax=Schizopora paradoxa TaxID=27342 RepID=A0A0H2S0J7_9AGAM|nr:hypothetical protein SCHPADRAFT_515611 [Schizopora paradoxa]
MLYPRRTPMSISQYPRVSFRGRNWHVLCRYVLTVLRRTSIRHDRRCQLPRFSIAIHLVIYIARIEAYPSRISIFYSRCSWFRKEVGGSEVIEEKDESKPFETVDASWAVIRYMAYTSIDEDLLHKVLKRDVRTTRNERRKNIDSSSTTTVGVDGPRTSSFDRAKTACMSSCQQPRRSPQPASH